MPLSIAIVIALLSINYIAGNRNKLEGNGFVLSTEIDHDYICVFAPYTPDGVMRAEISEHAKYVGSIDETVDDGIFLVVLIKDGDVTARIRHRRIYGDYGEDSYGCRPRARAPTSPSHQRRNGK